MGGTCSTYGEERGCIGFSWGSLSDRDHLEDPAIEGWVMLRLIFRKWDVEEWTGSSWLRKGNGDGHL